MDAEGKPSCDYEDCDLSDTSRWIILFVYGEKEHENMKYEIINFSYVEDFASSNDYFIQEFSNVYAKVLSHGYDSLEVVF